MILDHTNPHNESKYKMNIYTENGYANRQAYLDSLAEDYGVDELSVYAIAAVLGPNEVFDGLVSAIEDMSDNFI